MDSHKIINKINVQELAHGPMSDAEWKELIESFQDVRPDKQSKCTWTPNANISQSPHQHEKYEPNRPKIFPDILHTIGHTPLVQLNKIPKEEGVKCQILTKCEFMNPGGSIKDRICWRMIKDAEKEGILKPGMTIIEPSSGNTAIGLATAAAIHGYKCIIVMPKKVSMEKEYILKALGAEVVRTPTEAAFDAIDGALMVTHRLNRKIPNSIVLNQYRNPGNPLMHYDTTAMEILDQTDHKIDVIVIGAGTTGTIAGIGRQIKTLLPNCMVVGVDPYGSILAEPPELNVSDVKIYQVEGIGYDFDPVIFDRKVIDKWVKVSDKESFLMGRRLIKEEGLLCGGSSGAAVHVACQIAKNLPADKKCVVILPDSIRNYMTKFINDDWMIEHGFLSSGNSKNGTV